MAISIAKIPDSIFRRYSNKNAEMLEEAILNGVLLPDDATNGDIIKTLFPHISVEDNCQKYYSVDIENLSKDKALNTIGFRKEWWDAPYKVGDTDE